MVADHQNKADITSKLVREWISEKKISALIDVISTPAALAAQRLANENKVISLFSGSATTDLINAGCSNISFLWNFDTYSMAAGFGAGISGSMPNKKWFLVTVDNKFGEQLEANLVEVLKGLGSQIIGSVKAPLGNLDYSAVIYQARASGADIVGLLISSADLVNFVKQAEEYKLTAGGKRLAAPLLFTSDVSAMGPEAAKDLITGTSFYWNRTRETREWSLRYFKKYGRMPNEQNAGAYSMTSHYLKAVQAAGTVDSDKVAAKMRELPLHDFFSANGYIRKDGRMVHDTFVARVRAIGEQRGLGLFRDSFNRVRRQIGVSYLKEHLPSGRQEVTRARIVSIKFG
ncbi:ABC transporter substrate-binding protein [Polaromonas sp. P1-6]|nr:ABC transporter substrate-binding protein [Polaromonas sp. P1-6]